MSAEGLVGGFSGSAAADNYAPPPPLEPPEGQPQEEQQPPPQEQEQPPPQQQEAQEEEEEPKPKKRRVSRNRQPPRQQQEEAPSSSRDVAPTGAPKPLSEYQVGERVHPNIDLSEECTMVSVPVARGLSKDGQTVETVAAHHWFTPHRQRISAMDRLVMPFAYDPNEFDETANLTDDEIRARRGTQ